MFKVFIDKVIIPLILIGILWVSIYAVFSFLVWNPFWNWWSDGTNGQFARFLLLAIALIVFIGDNANDRP